MGTSTNIVADASFWSSFLASFWSQLLATLVTVIIGSIIAPRIIRWSQRAKLTFYNAHTPRGTNFQFVQAPNGEWEMTMQLVVRNEGSKTIERFYWEMYFDKNVTFNVAQKAPYPKYFTSDEEVKGDFRHRYGFIEIPVFPLDSVPFVHEMKFRVPQRKEVNIYYYFRTDLGESPIFSWAILSWKKFSWLKKLTIS